MLLCPPTLSSDELQAHCNAFLSHDRIHPEAQKILGNSSVPIVSLEPLNYWSFFATSLQPVVSLVRLPTEMQVNSGAAASNFDPIELV